MWGLAFKPQTDDMREAPAIVLIDKLLDAGAKVRASDPEAIHNAEQIFGDRVQFIKKNYEALEGADALVLVTEWSLYRRPDFDHIKENLKEPVIFDGRNIYDDKKMRRLGFHYYGIGTANE